MRRLNLRILALALILVFTQKMGLRLWMHRWLHETRPLSASHLPTLDQWQPPCDCIDDFLMPLTESTVIKIQQPVRTFHIIDASYCAAIHPADVPHASLRGPPAGPLPC